MVSLHLKVSKLGKLLPTVIQKTSERFGVLMSDFMGPDIASLSETFLTYITGKWFLPCMATLMGLSIK